MFLEFNKNNLNVKNAEAFPNDVNECVRMQYEQQVPRKLTILEVEGIWNFTEMLNSVRIISQQLKNQKID